MLVNAERHHDPISWLVGVLQGLVTGVYFPIALLPATLATAALLLPQTYAVDAAHRLLLPAANTPRLPILAFLPLVQADLAVLLVLALLLPVAGLRLFVVGLNKARRDGGLSRWM